MKIFSLANRNIVYVTNQIEETGKPGRSSVSGTQSLTATIV